MRVRHPYSLDDGAPEPDATVHWGGRRDWSDVDEDGTFYVPDGEAESFVESWPTANGYGAADLLVSGGDESGPSGGASDDAADGPDSDDEGGTCAATTADDEPCSNPAGEDGYCHLAGHGPED